MLDTETDRSHPPLSPSTPAAQGPGLRFRRDRDCMVQPVCGADQELFPIRSLRIHAGSGSDGDTPPRFSSHGPIRFSVGLSVSLPCRSTGRRTSKRQRPRK